MEYVRCGIEKSELAENSGQCARALWCAAGNSRLGVGSALRARDRADGYRSALRNFLQALSGLTMELVGHPRSAAPLYPCCSTEDVPEPAMAIEYGTRSPFRRPRWHADSIPRRNTVPFACDGDDLPACAIGNDFREDKHAALKLRFGPRTAPFLEPRRTPCPSWTPHPPRPRSPMPNDRASILSCKVVQRRRRIAARRDAMDVGICIRPCCGAERVGERHWHRRSGDRSARETRRVGGMDQFPTRGVGSDFAWGLSFSTQTTARWAHCRLRLIVAVLAGLWLWFMHQTSQQRVGAQR